MTSFTKNALKLLRGRSSVSHEEPHDQILEQIEKAILNRSSPQDILGDSNQRGYKPVAASLHTSATSSDQLRSSNSTEDDWPPSNSHPEFAANNSHPSTSSSSTAAVTTTAEQRQIPFSPEANPPPPPPSPPFLQSEAPSIGQNEIPSSQSTFQIVDPTNQVEVAHVDDVNVNNINNVKSTEKIRPNAFFRKANNATSEGRDGVQTRREIVVLTANESAEISNSLLLPSGPRPQPLRPSIPVTQKGIVLTRMKVNKRSSIQFNVEC